MLNRFWLLAIFLSFFPFFKKKKFKKTYHCTLSASLLNTIVAYFECEKHNTFSASLWRRTSLQVRFDSSAILRMLKRKIVCLLSVYCLSAVCLLSVHYMCPQAVALLSRIHSWNVLRHAFVHCVKYKVKCKWGTHHWPVQLTVDAFNNTY